jgi:hypothetical protein
MPSIFPGIDPFLELSGLWHDFHLSIIPAIRDQLQPELIDRGYFAQLGERIVVVHDYPRPVEPDVTIVRRSPSTGSASAGSATLEVEAEVPVEVELSSYEERQPFLEIRASKGEVITSLEVLSPTNKRPVSGRRKYLRKQQEAIDGGVNLVEIDLLHGGRHTIAVPRSATKDNAALADWYSLICVHRADQGPRFQLYPVLLTSSLPRIRIPLRAGERDVVLPLQPIFDRIFDNAGYARFIDYRAPLPASFSEAERAFVRSILALAK